MRHLIIVLSCCVMSSCSTAVAVLDVAGSAVVYGAKTVVNVIDAITPDIVNKK